MSPRSVGRIRQRSTFVALRRPAGRANLGPLRASWVAPGRGDRFPQVGYAIGRRYGTAVQRNQLRRRLREAVRRDPPPAGRYLVTAEPGARELEFAELTSTVGSAMRSAAARGSR